MRSIELKAQAKINLALDVLKKRPDGYHEVKMIMQTLELYDSIILEEIKEGIVIDCNSPWVPSNNQNIAYKAAELFLMKNRIKSGVSIKINKRIPVAAGLAGGSSNAAAVLKGLNEMFSVGINREELMALGKQIGADVPYCIQGGTMLSEGIGEVLTELSSLPPIDIILVKPKIGVSTAWVYKNLDLEKIRTRPDIDKLIVAIKDKDIKFISENMKNVLETVTIPNYKVIEEIKCKLNKLGALGSMMSGSGPTVFGVFPDRKMAEKAFLKLKDDHQWERILTYTSST